MQERTPRALPALGFRHQRLDFGAGWHPAGAADAAALEASDRGAEAQRFHLGPSLRQRQREPAVQSVAGGKRIDGANFEHRQAADRTVLQIENVVWTIADRQ